MSAEEATGFASDVPSASTQSDGNETEKVLKLHFDGRGVEILKFIGFEMEILSNKTARGRFVVSENSCQPFGVLHGGTTAFIAEQIASTAGAHASNFQRVAGIELNVNHLRPAPVGSEILVTASPFLLGSRLQVWEVKFESEKPKKLEIESKSSPPKLALIAVARVTLIVGVPQKDSEAPNESISDLTGLRHLNREK